MHGKERVVTPLFRRALGLRVRLKPSINTDCLGTFSRDIDRTESQVDAARAKIATAFKISPGARAAVEDSFGPHPQIPFLPLARSS